MPIALHGDATDRRTGGEWLAERVPDAPVNPEGGRPAMDKRQALRGIFCVLHNGAKWKDLPRQFGAKSEVHQYFTMWLRLASGRGQPLDLAFSNVPDRAGIGMETGGNQEPSSNALATVRLDSRTANWRY